MAGPQISMCLPPGRPLSSAEGLQPGHQPQERASPSSRTNCGSTSGPYGSTPGPYVSTPVPQAPMLAVPPSTQCYASKACCSRDALLLLSPLQVSTVCGYFIADLRSGGEFVIYFILNLFAALVVVESLMMVRGPACLLWAKGGQRAGRLAFRGGKSPCACVRCPAMCLS